MCIGYMQILWHHIRDLNILGFWHPQQVLEPIPRRYQGATVYVYISYSHNLASTSINLVFFLLVNSSVPRFSFIGFLCIKTLSLLFGYFRRHWFLLWDIHKVRTLHHHDSSGLPSSQYGLSPFQPDHLSYLHSHWKLFRTWDSLWEHLARALSWQRRGGAFWQLRGPSWSLPHTGENGPKLKEGWKFRFSKLWGEAPWNYTTQILGHLGFWVRVGGCPTWWSGRFETKHVTELGSWSSPGSLSDLQLTACLQGIGSLTAVDVQVLAGSRGWRGVWRRLLWTLSLERLPWPLLL